MTTITPEIVRQVRELLGLPEDKAPSVLISRASMTDEPFVSWWDTEAQAWRHASVGDCDLEAK